MTNPTLTYGHGYLTDCADTTSWGENVGGGMVPGNCELTVIKGGIFQIEATAGGTSDEYVYYEKDVTNWSLNNVHESYVLRWKTSELNQAFGARVSIVTTGAVELWVLGETAPQFSTDWHVKIGTLQGGSTVDKIRFYADDYADVINSGTSYVYYDFLLFTEGVFTWPFIQGDVELTLENQYANLLPPGRVGSHTQFTGMEDPIIRLNGTIDSNSDWGTPDGEYLMRVMHEAANDPWQWFTSDVINCKVVPRKLTLAQRKDFTAERVWQMELQMVNDSCGSESTWDDLQWFNV